MRLLTSKTFHQPNCASVTRLPPFFHVGAILSWWKRFLPTSSQSLLATWSFICQNWINIVDGTNIVNLPGRMEQTEFNLVRQCHRGKPLRDSGTLLKVSRSGEVIGPDKRGDAEFALINAKVPLQCRSGAFLCLCSFFRSTLIWVIH